jgi:fibronectin-binding autotransporter adhesin
LSGTVSLTNGATLNAAVIQKGAAASTATTTNQIIWGDGTIGNLPGAGLGVSGVNLILAGNSTSHNLHISPGQLGTVSSDISGIGSLTCTGGGTLMLSGPNTFTGTTTVSSGTVLVNGTLGTNVVVVSSSGTLGGSGNIAGAVTVQTGGAVQNSPGNLTAAALTLGTTGAATTSSQFTLAAGGWIAAGSLSVNGTNIINILDTNLVTGTNTLFTYTGTIGGSSGFGGFQVGTVPAGFTALLQNTDSAVQLVVSPSPPPVLNGISTFNAGNYQFSFSGANSQPYRILCSTNLFWPLSNWMVLGSGTFGTGMVNYTDLSATNAQRFYRIASP